MARTSFPWYTVTAKIFIFVVGILGMTLMTIATYDMIQTLDKAKLSNKVREDILRAEKVNAEHGYKDKDGTFHKMSSGHVEATENSRHPSTVTEVAGDWNTQPTVETTQRNGKPPNKRNPNEAELERDSQRGSDREEYTQGPWAGQEGNGNGFPESATDNFGWKQTTRTPHRTPGHSIHTSRTTENPSVIFPEDSQPEFGGGIDPRWKGSGPRRTRQNLQRIRRQAGQENTSERPDETSKETSGGNESNVVLTDVNKTYRGILIGCQIVAILLGFIQVVSSCGIVCSCSPYVPKRVKQWLVINVFVLLVGFLCFIIPLTINPGDGSWLDTSKVKDNLVAKYEELKDLEKKEVLLRNLFLYATGINEAFLLLTIVVVSSLLPYGTQPYDSVY